MESNLQLVKIIQEAAFKEDLQALKSKGHVSRKSSLLNLAPFIDKQNVIRVGGRLQNAAISPDARHPILLSANHPFTHLVIAQEHQRQLHAGAQATLAAVRVKYWPFSARNSVKKYIKKCTICFKANPRTSEAIMSELPLYRVTSSKPFACRLRWSVSYKIEAASQRQVNKGLHSYFRMFSHKSCTYRISE